LKVNEEWTGKRRLEMKCNTCGLKIDGDLYNPYNVTFKEYECRNEDRKMCKQCAEKFVAKNNQYKGGRWETRTVSKIEKE
jgi:hypothetical protein